MSAMRRGWGWVAAAGAVAAALYVVRFRLGEGWFPSQDLYGYFLPNILYALASLSDGGQGLLWNPFQNCGQPFLGISQTGILYPPYWLFLILEPHRALTAVEVLNLTIGGLGAFWLGRELGIGNGAALAGALAFELGNTMIGLTAWNPMNGSSYPWMPVALLCCERLLKEPTARRGASLAIVLAVGLLPGMPQMVHFTYQLILLRVAWEIVTRSSAATMPLFGALALGLTLPFLIAAVQFLPALETAAESIRNRPLTAGEIYPFGPGRRGDMWIAILLRSLNQPFMLIPCMLVGPALCSPMTRRLALFYAGAALLYVGLSFGPGTPFFDLYALLPQGRTFRDPLRFFWVTGFCLAVVTGLGCAALAASARQSRFAWWAALVLAALPPLSLVLLAHAALSLPAAQRGILDLTASSASPLRNLMPPGSLRPWEGIAIVVFLAAAVLARRNPRFAAAAVTAVGTALIFQLVGAPGSSNLHHLDEPAPYFAKAAALRPMQQSLTAQDRVYLLHEAAANTRFAFMAKTPSLLRFPAVLDYEPLVTQRYAEFSVMLRAGRPMHNLPDVLLRGPELARTFSRPLLDLTAARYLILSPSRRASIEHIEPPLVHRYDAGDLHVYENPQRFPRAFFVPRVEVIVNPQALLDRLGGGAQDLRNVALIEETPPSDFTGGPLPAGMAAIVTFARNDPEHLILRIDAPARGFLVLTDQYFPGWSATVGGAPVPILRANYAFRLVEVPEGESVVEFLYRPRSLRLGAAVSAAALACIGIIFLHSRGARNQS
jgi:hypothetical protein